MKEKITKEIRNTDGELVGMEITGQYDEAELLATFPHLKDDFEAWKRNNL